MKKVLQIHRSAQYIVSRLTPENAKNYFERLNGLLKGKNNRKRISILNDLQSVSKWKVNRAGKALFSSQKNILLKDNANAKFEIYEEGTAYGFWESKPLRIVNTLLLLDFCFEPDGTEPKEGELKSNKKIEKYTKIENKVSKLTFEEKRNILMKKCLKKLKNLNFNRHNTTQEEKKNLESIV